MPRAVPAGSATGPRVHSAAVMFEPPFSTSEICAVSVAAPVFTIGVGLDWMLPATTAGPTTSPPTRFSVKTALLTSAPLKLGVPLSETRTRTRASARWR